jgi:hypothetical protein
MPKIDKRVCKYEGCKTRASYGKIVNGIKQLLYCSTHGKEKGLKMIREFSFFKKENELSYMRRNERECY